jgi:protein-S-isoprenylcysteine O-methyltransferase Ste14
VPAKIHTDAIGLTALILVVAGWIFFAAIFLLRKRPSEVAESKRAPLATVGIVLQSLSFVLVTNLRRAFWWPFAPSLFGEVALAALAVLLTWLSAWFCLRAVQTLGKQWTFAARVITGHELITEGPYSVVRHPIYLGLFGLMLGTGLVLATWWALVSAVVIYLVGNRIRIRAEEQLLKETFGRQFQEYASRVPAFLPRIF